MPTRLKRFHESKQTHFVTFTCYHRRKLLLSDEAAQAFLATLERIRLGYRFRVYGFVLMPDHVHSLMSEPDRSTLSEVVKSLKQSVSRRYASEDGRFWQARYYDRNVRDHEEFVEKLRYIHRNPVKAQLCSKPEEWSFSSFLHYAAGVAGVVEIESEWTARKRERARAEAKSRPPCKQRRLAWATTEFLLLLLSRW